MGWLQRDGNTITGSDIPSSSYASTSTSVNRQSTAAASASLGGTISRTKSNDVARSSSVKKHRKSSGNAASHEPSRSSGVTKGRHSDPSAHTSSYISPLIDAPNTRVLSPHSSGPSHKLAHKSYVSTITFAPHQTDASTSNWPPFGYNFPADRGPDSDNPYTDYVRIDDGEINQDHAIVNVTDAVAWKKTVDRWKVKIGTWLGNRRDLTEEEYADPTRHRVYTLTNFPAGYALMEKMRLTGASRGRRDQYFQGSKAGQFRSPAEFFEHAEWLLNDMEGQCQCQYCYKDYVGRGSKKSINYTTS